MATLEQLLMMLNGGNNLPDLPAPAQPLSLGPLQPPATPQYGGPSSVSEPPTAPLNTDIIKQYLALQGPAPTAPTAPTRGERIARGLIGFGAGYEGRGPEFLRQLQEPQREYQQRLERYNNNRSDLALRGSEAAMRDQERRTERAQRIADQQFEAEFQRESRRLGLADSEAHERLRQSFELQKQAAAFAAEERRELAREQRAREVDAKQIASRYFTATKNMQLSRELGRYYAGLSEELSPQAARLDAHVQRASGGGGRSRTGSVSNGAVRAAQEVEASKGELITFRQNQGRFNVKQQESEERRIRARIGRALGALRKFPGQLEGGTDANGWPYVKVLTPQGGVALPGFGEQPAQPNAQPQQPPGPTEQEIQAYAQQFKISPEKARQELSEMRR